MFIRLQNLGSGAEKVPVPFGIYFQCCSFWCKSFCVVLETKRLGECRFHYCFILRLCVHTCTTVNGFNANHYGLGSQHRTDVSLCFESFFATNWDSFSPSFFRVLKSLGSYIRKNAFSFCWSYIPEWSLCASLGLFVMRVRLQSEADHRLCFSSAHSFLHCCFQFICFVWRACILWRQHAS